MPKAKPKIKPAPKKKKSPPVSPQRLMELTWGFAPPLIVASAIELGLFNALDAGAKTVAALAAETGASHRGLTAIAEALAGFGLLAKKGEKFSLTPESSAFLVSTKPSFMGGIIRHVGRQLIPVWLDLPDIVRAGKPNRPVNQPLNGAAFFKDFVEDIFNMSFAPASLAADLLLGKAKGPQSVLDIAAGSGVWGIAMAKRSTQVRVTSVDWPDVIPVTRRVAERHGVADRITFVEGDIYDANLGSDHTIATLGHILHSEGQARGRHLLQRVSGAMAPGGTIVIGEFIPDGKRTSPPIPLIFAVNMLVNTDEGNVFTFKEMASWLKETGFKKPRLVPSPGPSPLIFAEKS